MKFRITDEQGENLSNIIAKHRAVSKTFQEAFKFHSQAMEELEEASNAVWDELATEHELDMINHDWAFTMLNGEPYIVSQKANSDD